MKVSKTGEDRRAGGGVVVLKKVTLEWPFLLSLIHRLPLEKEENYNKILLPY